MENWIHQNLQRTPQILPVDDILPSLQILTLLTDNLLTPSLISLSTSPNLLWHHEKDNLDTHPTYLIQAKSPHPQYPHLLHSCVPHPQTASGTNSQVYLPLTHPHHKPQPLQPLHLTTQTHQTRWQVHTRCSGVMDALLTPYLWISWKQGKQNSKG